MAPPPKLIDDAVAEILLRLPPDDPACLVRASLVCKPWRRVLSDPAFPLRYRAFHRTPPPLLGFVRSSRAREAGGSHLIVPFATRLLPFHQPPPMSSRPLDCRHGRVLSENVVCGSSTTRGSLAVWEPITGNHSVLPELDCRWPYIRCGVVACAAAGCDHRHDCHGGPFQVVFVGTTDAGVARAWVYSSETDAWSEPASVQLHGRHSSVKRKRGAIVGHRCYFLLNASTMLLKFDLRKHRLSMINSPQAYCIMPAAAAALMSMEDGRLGLAGIHGANLHLWSTKVCLEGPATTTWVPYRVVELGKLLPIDKPYHRVAVIGFAEGVGALLVAVDTTTIFAYELKSGQVRKLTSKPGCCNDEVFPFTSFYVPGTYVYVHIGSILLLFVCIGLHFTNMCLLFSCYTNITNI